MGLVSCSQAAPDTVFSEKRDMLSTYVTLSVSAGRKEAAQQGIDAGFNRIEALNKVLNAHDKSSELSKLNAAGGEPVKVSPDLLRAIQDGLEWQERTEGAFDIAIAPLLALWKTCAAENRLPEQKDLDQVRKLMDTSGIRIDPSTSTVTLPKDFHLDLGGLGKGFCADETERILKEIGVHDALIAIGGDVRAMGSRPLGMSWRVGVQDPRAPNNPAAILTVMELSDKSVSTSGNYQRYVEIDGKRYSHIVDPRTGLPADNVPSVTVIGPDTVTTDILGTALSVLGIEEGLKLVEGLPGVEALFILFDDSGEPQLTRSSGFSRFEALDARN
jgi:thiamine biosynthesis lipoprotein